MREWTVAGTNLTACCLELGQQVVNGPLLILELGLHLGQLYFEFTSRHNPQLAGGAGGRTLESSLRVGQRACMLSLLSSNRLDERE